MAESKLAWWPAAAFSEARLEAMERSGWTPTDVRDLMSAYRAAQQRIVELDGSTCQHCELSERLAKIRHHEELPRLLELLEIERERVISAYNAEPYHVLAEVLRV